MFAQLQNKLSAFWDCQDGKVWSSPIAILSIQLSTQIYLPQIDSHLNLKLKATDRHRCLRSYFSHKTKLDRELFVTLEIAAPPSFQVWRKNCLNMRPWWASHKNMTFPVFAFQVSLLLHCSSTFQSDLHYTANSLRRSTTLKIAQTCGNDDISDNSEKQP